MCMDKRENAVACEGRRVYRSNNEGEEKLPSPAHAFRSATFNLPVDVKRLETIYAIRWPADQHDAAVA